MADAPPGAKSGAKKEYAGIPLWGWVAAAVVVAGVAIYIYRRNAAASAATAAAPAGTAAGSGVSSLQGWILDNQASPAPAAAPAPAPGGTASPLRKVTLTARNRDIYRLARSYGMTESQFLKVNPGLKKYEGTGKAIPLGTKITVGGV